MAVNIDTSLRHAADIALLDAVLVDLTAIKTAIAGLNAKLDADGGVTGTDYAALWNVPALTTTT